MGWLGMEQTTVTLHARSKARMLVPACFVGSGLLLSEAPCLHRWFGSGYKLRCSPYPGEAESQKRPVQLQRLYEEPPVPVETPGSLDHLYSCREYRTLGASLL